jgi:tRNA pseudouridine55 synthase
VEQACDKLVKPNELLNWETVEVGEEDAKKILNGLPVAGGQRAADSGNLMFVTNNGHIIAVAELQNGYLVPKFQL